jgi:hypothetical protein
MFNDQNALRRFLTFAGFKIAHDVWNLRFNYWKLFEF